VVRALAGGDPAAARVVQNSPYLSGLLAEAQRPAAAPGDLDTARWQLTMDLADLISSAASRQPVLVVVDDLHEADPSTPRVLVDLAPALRSMAAVVLATAREDTHEWLDRQPGWEALTRLGENIRLSRFGAAEIAMLLQQALGQPAPAEVVRTIAARTSGNPLLACELIRTLPEASGDDPASMRTLARLVPTSVRAMVSARLTAATALARRVLFVAAVLGTPFRLDVLAEVAELPLAQLGEALGEARAANLLGEADPGEGGLRHELIRDALYEALPLQERTQLHRQAATVLATLAQRRRGVQAAEVAHHLLRAGPGCAGQLPTSMASSSRPGC
jgi:predicted ATPase